VGPQELLPTGAGLVLEHVQLCGEVVHLFAHLASSGASCPSCARWSEAFHSSYQRSVADLPIADRQVVAHLDVRRFDVMSQLARGRLAFSAGAVPPTERDTTMDRLSLGGREFDPRPMARCGFW